jgi:hypothetical protein
MAIAIRVRVTWDDTILEDRVFVGRKQVRIGAGQWAQASTPGQADRYVTLRRRGAGIELRIDPGAAEVIEFPGEERVDLGGMTTPFVRRLDPPYGSGKLTVGAANGTPTTIEFERVVVGDQARDRALLAWTAAAAVLALLSGGSYRLVRLFGDGDKPQWGRPPTISDRDASRMRVRIGPDGVGASRPQAGRGSALHGTPTGTPRALLAESHSWPNLPETQAAHPRPRHPSIERSGTLAVEPPAVRTNRRPPTVTLTPRVKEPPRDQVIEEAQGALLAADLRRAIDSFSRASKQAPLDYDQLNWLGLAHYLTAEYDDAERVWKEARVLDANRPDAVNNLASVAKRRGRTDEELALLAAALALQPKDCHASNSLALAQAKSGRRDQALATLAESDVSCGGGYAYTAIQKAGILALSGDRDGALTELESGLSRVDTLIAVKEFEVWIDLSLDPAFSSLRASPRFAQLVTKYLPRAATWKDVPSLAAAHDPDDKL